MKLSAYAKQQGISYQTAWRMWQRGELPAHQLPSGTVIVDVPPAPQAVRPQKVAVYARVSSAENRKNLDSQAERVARSGATAAFDATWPPDWPAELIPVRATFDSSYPAETQKRVLDRWKTLGL